MEPAENPVGRDEWPGLLAKLDAEVRRVARRLAGLSEPRLRRALPQYGTVADAGRRLAAALADGDVGVENRASPTPPAWRSVPELAVTAVGDQLAVLGHDVVVALRAVDPAEPVWTRSGRAPAAAVASDLYRLAHEIKLTVD